MFVFLARTAGARIVASYFSFYLAICRSLCAESCCHHSALWRKVAVNRCHSSSDAEDQFFSEFDIDIILVRAHFRIRIVFVG